MLCDQLVVHMAAIATVSSHHLLKKHRACQSEGRNNQRGEQKVTGAPGVGVGGQDVDGHGSIPVFYLTCDRRSRRLWFICSLSVHRRVSFCPHQRGEKTNETTNEIREREYSQIKESPTTS